VVKVEISPAAELSVGAISKRSRRKNPKNINAQPNPRARTRHSLIFSAPLSPISAEGLGRQKG
jgi:hypothetical protein